VVEPDLELAPAKEPHDLLGVAGNLLREAQERGDPLLNVLAQYAGAEPPQEDTLDVGPYDGRHVEVGVEGAARGFDGGQGLQQQGEPRRQLELVASQHGDQLLEDASDLGAADQGLRLEGDELADGVAE